MAMADLGIQTNIVQPQANPVRPAQAPAVQTPERPEVNPSAREPQEAAAEQAPQRPELENVVSVSEDGDTVQVSEEGNEKLEDEALGTVTVLNTQLAQDQEEAEEETQIQADLAEDKQSAARILEQQREAAAERKARMEALRESEEKRAVANEESAQQVQQSEEAEDQAAEAQAAKVTTYAGISESRLQQMVQQGEISRYKYDQEIEARESRVEAMRENDAQFSTQMTESAAREQENENDALELNAVFSEDSSDTLSQQTRSEIMSALQDFPFNDAT
ncbi:MAG: hypothetical protein K6E81_00975 [Lachnospiraceae bacterium]|nr:hypothetical protein [Lachnospiraceae bacterium]